MQFSLRDDAVSGKPDLQITRNIFLVISFRNMVVSFLPRFWSDSQMLLKAVSNLENWGAPAHPINLRKGLICHKTVKGRKRKMMNEANFSIAPASFTEVLNCFILFLFFFFFYELKCKCYFDLLVERGCPEHLFRWHRGGTSHWTWAAVISGGAICSHLNAWCMCRPLQPCSRGWILTSLPPEV